ncbi:MAG TPA: HD-GYP domain-containing protein [Streptosporangiaceae bacterium]|nr:HD-GYP domain-containing protein [Streptosporangiaceae bacterium]
MRGLPLAAWAYVCGVIASAGVIVSTALSSSLPWLKLAVLGALFLACESVPALLNIQRAVVSLSFSVGLASVVLVGPDGAALVGAVAMFSLHRGISPVKRLYNGAQHTMCCFLAGQVYASLGGQVGLPDADTFPSTIGPYIAAVVTYVTLNLVLMGCILVLSGHATAGDLRWRAVGQLTVSCLGFGMVGLLIAGLWKVPYSAVLAVLPLFITRWAFAQTRAQQEAYEATIATLCQAVETKDFYTRGHSERVSRGSVMIAQEIGMRPERVKAIRYAGMLHDVGKLGVPTKVLQKPGGLTEEELAAIQLHPMRGLEIVREIGFLDEALAGIMHHHEKMDGRGYPMGLAGDEIPVFARIIAVADAFDCMTSDRSYRGRRALEEAIAELRRSSGGHFDPDVVDAFLRALERDGWPSPKRVPLPDSDVIETTEQDHDDPTAPLKIVGDGARS